MGQLKGKISPLQLWRVAAGVILICLVGLASSYVFFSGRFRWQDQWIIYLKVEPPFSSQEQSQDAMSGVISSLEQRARDLGIVGAEFKIIGTNEIEGTLPIPQKSQGLLNSFVRIGLFELVDIGDEALEEGEIVSTDNLHPAFPTAAPGEKIFKTILTGKDMDSAAVIKDPNGGYGIDFILNESGTKKFAEFTSKNIGRYMAILLDKTAVSSPRVLVPILIGHGQFYGNMSSQQANKLAAALLSHPLPIRLVIEREEFIPASLSFLNY